MMPQKLYILPFDHRESFAQMFGFLEDEVVTPEEVSLISDYKHIVYEGFLLALKMGVPKESAAILVDERYGDKIQEEARSLGITRIIPTEKSGQDEFDFQYSHDFIYHIEKYKPDYVKVLVRYSPAGDKELNVRQIARLKTINEFCHENHYKFLFELLVRPPSDARIMLASIKELQDNGIEPDIWKVEGVENFDEMRQVVEQVRSRGRQDVGVVVLGRGESDAKVRSWLTIAAKIPGVVGFAVGRTVFKKPLLDYHQGTIKREEAAQAIAQNYKSFVDLFEADSSSI